MKEIIRRRPELGIIEYRRVAEDGKLRPPVYGFTEGAFEDEQRGALAKEAAVQDALGASATQSDKSGSEIQFSGSVKED